MRLPVLVACLFGVVDAAVVIDRIAVVVGTHAIKRSDIERDLRLTQFLNRQPEDLSPAARRQAAERLVDQEIIRREIELGGIGYPSDEEVSTLLQQIRRDRFGGSEARMKAELLARGITEEQLRAQLLWQLTVLRFIDERFRAGVLVSDQEVKAYYDERLADLKKANPNASSLEAMTPKIRETLEGEQINKNFEEWLAEAQKMNRIEFREAGLK